MHFYAQVHTHIQKLKNKEDRFKIFVFLNVYVLKAMMEMRTPHAFLMAPLPLGVLILLLIGNFVPTYSSQAGCSLGMSYALTYPSLCFVSGFSIFRPLSSKASSLDNFSGNLLGLGITDTRAWKLMCLPTQNKNPLSSF